MVKRLVFLWFSLSVCVSRAEFGADHNSTACSQRSGRSNVRGRRGTSSSGAGSLQGMRITEGQKIRKESLLLFWSPVLLFPTVVAMPRCPDSNTIAARNAVAVVG